MKNTGKALDMRMEVRHDPDRDICVSFRRGGRKRSLVSAGTQVLFDVSLSIPKGSCLGILGESGSGKSTLGRVICGLLKPDSGEYLLEGEKCVCVTRWKEESSEHAQRCIPGLYDICKSAVQDPGYSGGRNPGEGTKERKKRTGARNTADFWS